MTRNGRRTCARLLSRLAAVLCTALFASSLFAQDAPRPPQTGPVLNELVLQNATVFTREDVMWLLDLRIGAPLPGSPEDDRRLAAPAIRARGIYRGRRRAGLRQPDRPAHAHSSARGASTRSKSWASPRTWRSRSRRAWRPTTSARGRCTTGARWEARSSGCSRRPRARSAWAARATARATKSSSSIATAGRSSIVPLRRERGPVRAGRPAPRSREDLYNPVDGFAPGLGFHATVFDRTSPNYTFISGYVSYKFSREDTGYSFGIERRAPERPAAVPRRGGARPDRDRRPVAVVARWSSRWSRSASRTRSATTIGGTARRSTSRSGPARSRRLRRLVAMGQARARCRTKPTSACFATARRSARTRPSRPASSTRSCSRTRSTAAASRATGSPPGSSAISLDDLFRGTRRQAYGWRIDWTSEVAGHGAGGDYTFDRHILNARAYVPVLPRQSVAARLIAGFSGGTLADRAAVRDRRRRHGARLRVQGGRRRAHGARQRGVPHRSGRKLARRPQQRLGAVVFFDAGRIDRPIGSSSTEWLRGIGAGLQAGPFRIEVGYRLNDIPQSRQILVRLGPTF